MITPPNPNFELKNPEFRASIRKHLEKQMFMKHIGCVLTQIEPGYVVAEINIAENHEQQIGLIHGGVTATIADVAAGFAGFTLVGPNEHTVTAEIKISYLRKGRGGILRAVGRVLKAGSSFHFCTADVYCITEGTQILIAQATATMAIITPNRTLG
jgi:uncharacterized protein (TIGR00369 family)